MKFLLEKFIRPKPQKKGLSLLEEAEIARREWLNALQELDYLTDADMLDHIIYKINAAERRFIALLKQAQQEELKAWPVHLKNPEAELQEEKTLNNSPAPVQKEAVG